MTEETRPAWPSDPVERAAAAAVAGLRGTDRRRAAEEAASPDVAPADLAALAASDPDGRVRAAALGAVVRRAGRRAGPAWRRALDDDDPAVRRRACELAPAVRPRSCARLVAAVGDPDPGVAEAAAFALGELGTAARAAGAVEVLAGAVGSHPDPLVREAAVAALGSLGDPAGLPAVLAAGRDRPAVRRRAVVALAAFEGAEVEAALADAVADRDWQVRQVAEDLLARPPEG